MVPTAVWMGWAVYRWYFFGKIQAFWHYYHGEEEMRRRALEDKRFKKDHKNIIFVPIETGDMATFTSLLFRKAQRKK